MLVMNDKFQACIHLQEKFKCQIYWKKNLLTPIVSKLFNARRSHHIETSQMICSANQLTGFYMMGTLVVKNLN